MDSIKCMAANISWSSDNNLLSAKIQVLSGKILAWSDTVTGQYKNYVMKFVCKYGT